MKQDVGMSNPKKYVNKIGMVLTQEINVGPKIKQTTSIYPYISTALCLLLYSSVVLV